MKKPDSQRQQRFSQFEKDLEARISSTPSVEWPLWCKVVAFAVLAAFTLGLRLYHLDYESLFLDELRQVSYYPNSTGQIIGLAASQAQPPLDYWLGHFVFLFSYSDFSVRLPAALFGLGSVLIIVAVLLSATNPAIAFSTGLLASLLPFNLYFSQYARPYSIAIFFMLLTVYLLDRAIKQREQSLLNQFLVFVCALLFLYSRAYPPLLIVAILIAILLLRLLYLFFDSSGRGDAKVRYRIVFAILGLAAAALAYLPMMSLITNMGQRYASRASQPLIDILVNGWSHFALWPIWEAYLTQSEPLGFLLLPLWVITPFFLMLNRWRGNFMLFSLTLLLPSAALLDGYVFPAMSDFPYRTSYPIYLLPVCLTLAASVYYFLWECAGIVRKGALFLHGILLLFGIGCIILTARASLDFENTRKNENWKGLSQYLGKTTGSQQFLIFDAITPLGVWEPTFYGFPRYYQGNANPISMVDIPIASKEMLTMTLEPVAVLFAYRNIYLTSTSLYPVMPAPQGVTIKLDPIGDDPELTTQAFTSFLTARLKSPTGNCAVDTLKLIQLIQARLKADSSIIHLQLAAGALAQALGNNQLAGQNLKQAVELAPSEQQAAVAKSAEAIRSNP